MFSENLKYSLETTVQYNRVYLNVVESGSHVFSSLNTQTHTHIYTHTETHMHVHTHIYIHTHTDIYTEVVR